MRNSGKGEESKEEKEEKRQGGKRQVTLHKVS